MKTFRLPDLGEGLAEAEIRQWLVKEGDVVEIDEPMLTVETAKAVVEVPAPRSGKISKLYGKAGEMVQVGAPLVEFADGEDIRSHKDAGTVAGRVEVGNTIIDEPAMGLRPKTSRAGIKATPAVRALAKQLNVDLNTVKATGTNGQITAEDVKKSQTAEPKEGFEPLRGVRRTMINVMAQSHAEIVPVTLQDDADIHKWAKDTDIMARIIRALIAGCRAEPNLNAWYDTKTMSRKIISTIDIGIAVDSDEGLFVPVLKDAAAGNPKTWRETIERFKKQIKDRSIPADELRGASIMLSNFGTFAGRYANPVIVPPLVAILGVGKIRDEVVAYQGEMVVHRILPLSVSMDHRAVTGGEVSRFLGAVINDLELEK